MSQQIEVSHKSGSNQGSLWVKRSNRRLVVQMTTLLLIAGVIPFTLATDSFTRGVATLLSIYIVLSVSFQMVFGQTGLISFGHAAMAAIGAYVSSLLQVKSHFNMVLSWALGIIAVMIIAGIVGWAILRLGMLFLAVVTLSLGEAAIYLISQFELTGGENGMPVPPFMHAGRNQSLADYVLAATLMLIVLSIAFSLPSTTYGREMKAVGDDPVAAESCGIPVARRRVEVFAFSSGIAAAAGIVYAHTARFISPSSFSLNLGILILAMVAVGGMKSIWGAIVGTTFLALLPEFFASLQEYSTLIYGMVLVVIFRFAPEGLAGLSRTLVSRARRDRLRLVALSSGKGSH